MLTTLNRAREDLLREYMLAKGMEKAEVLAKILELDYQIEEERNRRNTDRFSR